LFSDGKVLPQHLIGQIAFSDIQFRYPTRPEVPVFNGLNLSVPSGSVVAVVGSSGSGKSTLPALLMRFYDPTAGSIFIDGVDIKEYSPQWLRSNMSIVNQVPS
jgi:ABC-type multidrug transport system fused ATPase/permease subunit